MTRPTTPAGTGPAARPALRRVAAATLAVILLAGAPAGFGSRTSAAPTVAPSVGNSVLFHLQLATDIDQSGNPIGQGTSFPTGTQVIFGFLGLELRAGGHRAAACACSRATGSSYEAAHVVQNESGPRGRERRVRLPVLRQGRLGRRRLLRRGPLQPRPRRGRPLHGG